MQRWLPALLLLASCHSEPAAITAPPAPATDAATVDQDQHLDLSQLVGVPPHGVFDLPALHNKTISQIRAQLGAPDWDDSDPHNWDKTDPQPIPKEWDKTYSKDGIMLNIRYFYRTGKVKYFYLQTQYGCVEATPVGFRSLLAAGNLTPTSRQYRSYPVYYNHNKASQRYSMVMLAPR